jgi:tRNA A-37 threonylcarbamoyl transferase component Bud32
MRAWRLVDDPVSLGTTKNLTRRCRDSRGRRVLLKCAPNPLDRGITREARALETLGGLASRFFRVPKVIAFEPRGQVLALEWIDARSRRLPSKALAPLGRALGVLHAQTSGSASWDWAAPPPEALIDCFVWTRPAFATRLSIDGMHLFGTVQANRAAIAGLIELSTAPRSCLIHGDAKALNVLLPRRGAGVWIDWELAQHGDPAQDLGCLLGDFTRCHVAPESPSERIDAATLRAATKAVLDGYSRERRLDAAERHRVQLWIGASLLIYAHVLVMADGVASGWSNALLARACELLAESA